MIKIVIIAFMFAIVVALGSGLVFLIRDASGGRRVAKALTWRIGLSLLLIVLLVLGYFAGVVPMHNLGQ